jgi:hypothetical protein
VKPLEPPDGFHLLAAHGWLELGNHAEANEELEKIAPELRARPDVLKVRWEIYAAENGDYSSRIVWLVPTIPRTPGHQHPLPSSPIIGTADRLLRRWTARGRLSTR